MGLELSLKHHADGAAHLLCGPDQTCSNSARLDLLRCVLNGSMGGSLRKQKCQMLLRQNTKAANVIMYKGRE